MIVRDDHEVVLRHVEVFYAVATGEPIQLWCDCPIGRTHTYEDWVDRFHRSASAGEDLVASG